MKIRTVTVDDIDNLLPLINAYQEFYKTKSDDDRNEKFFKELAQNPDDGIQFVAEDSSGFLGFATLYFPNSSTMAQKSCLMNDLFTTPSARGKGVGRALIKYCAAFAAQRGYSELEWLTQKSNHKAQRLYDSLKTSRQEWFYYVMNTDAPF